MTQRVEGERPEVQIPKEDADRISKYLKVVKQEHDLVIHNIGDWTKGEIEIVTDPVEIYAAEQNLKPQDPAKPILQAFIVEGPFSTYINHIVKRADSKSPIGFSYGSFHEVVWNFERRGNLGNVALPIWTDKDGVKRICLIKTFKRPRGRWQAEVPGFSQENDESTEEAIVREIWEETKYKVVSRPFKLGNSTSDSGLLHIENNLWYVPVEPLEVSGVIDAEEAISDRVFLTVDEVKKAVISGKVKFKDEEIPLVDGKLLMVFCQASIRGLI